MARILVVDDEVGIRELLSEILYDEGHTVDLAENAAVARLARQQHRPDLVLLDIWMPDTDGVSLLKEWASSGLLTMPVVMMSGHATIDTAVEATRIGAVDFLEKPITLQKLLDTVENALERGRQVLRTLHGSAPKPDTKVPVAGATGTQATSSLDPPAVAAVGWPDFTQARIPPGQEGATAAITELELDRPLREARDEFERVYFEHHLRREGGSMSRVAARTGLERTHLYRKLKQLGIDLKNRRTTE
jgi:DNA-binding NtrC family response regulator